MKIIKKLKDWWKGTPVYIGCICMICGNRFLLDINEKHTICQKCGNDSDNKFQIVNREYVI